MFNFDLALDIDEGLLSRADDLAVELDQEITNRLGVAVSEVRIEDDGSVGFSVEAADAVAQEKVLADLRAALVDGGTIGGFDVVAVVALHRRRRRRRRRRRASRRAGWCCRRTRWRARRRSR